MIRFFGFNLDLLDRVGLASKPRFLSKGRVNYHLPLKVGHNSREFSPSVNVLALVVLADGHAHKMEALIHHLKETFLHYFHIQSRKRTHT